MNQAQRQPQSQLQKYCEILGVGPGATADQVQKEFRIRIKELHPDKLRHTTQSANVSGNPSQNIQEKQQAPAQQAPAQHAPAQQAQAEQEKQQAHQQAQASLLIEAYRALKKGVPAVSAFDRQRERGAAAGMGRSYSRGYNAGEKIFANLFRSVDIHTLRRLHRKLYGFDAAFLQNGDAFRQSMQNQKVAPDPRETAGFGHHGHQAAADCPDFERAEDTLANIIAFYHRGKMHTNKMRLRDYLRELTQAQVLYRDVCRIHPAYSGQSLRRIRQIHNLIGELKPLLRS